MNRLNRIRKAPNALNERQDSRAGGMHGSMLGARNRSPLFMDGEWHYFSYPIELEDGVLYYGPEGDPNERWVHPDGTIQYPDGTMERPDGSGISLDEDGNLFYYKPDGTFYPVDRKPDGTLQPNWDLGQSPYTPPKPDPTPSWVYSPYGPSRPDMTEMKMNRLNRIRKALNEVVSPNLIAPMMVPHIKQWQDNNPGWDQPEPQPPWWEGPDGAPYPPEGYGGGNGTWYHGEGGSYYIYHPPNPPGGTLYFDPATGTWSNYPPNKPIEDWQRDIFGNPWWIPPFDPNSIA